MRKSRFTETQIVAILEAADVGMKASELCRQHGISMPLTTNENPNTAAWRHPT
ncbi:MAG: hypothetical protein ACI9DC_002513 [Gammaproteobacteria bacterium]|jgi:hypothetical protein